MAARVGAGLEAQIGGVGVGADDAVADLGRAVVVGGPRHQRSATGHEVPPCGRRPLVALVDVDEALPLQSPSDLGDGVIGRRRRVEEVTEVKGLRPQALIGLPEGDVVVGGRGHVRHPKRWPSGGTTRDRRPSVPDGSRVSRGGRDQLLRMAWGSRRRVQSPDPLRGQRRPRYACRVHPPSRATPRSQEDV